MEKIFLILFIFWAISYSISFVYMAKTRGILSALFWSIIPFRFLINSAIDGEYDDNPRWLDYIQNGIIAAFILVWIVERYLN